VRRGAARECRNNREIYAIVDRRMGSRDGHVALIHVLNEADMTLFQSDPTYRSHALLSTKSCLFSPLVFAWVVV
jgi:hypothetical protein